MKLKPLPKTVTDEIRVILEGCRDGRLKHDQTQFHCGTAHCIAGWKEATDYAKARAVPNITRMQFDAYLKVPMAKAHQECFMSWRKEWTSRHHGRQADSLNFAWSYARKEWNLTVSEAATLFWAGATFPEQFTLLEKLERGERLA